MFIILCLYEYNMKALLSYEFPLALGDDTLPYELFYSTSY